MHPPPLVVCLFCVTAGQNGENLGSDEEQLVLVAYVVYEVAENKILLSKHHYIKPISIEELQELQQQKLQQKEQQLQQQQQTNLQQQQIKNFQQQKQATSVPQQKCLQPQQQQPMLIDYVLTEECKIQTGMDENLIKHAATLDHVLMEMEKNIEAAATGKGSTKHVVFLTDGPLHLRMCLIPEATTKEIPLSNKYFSYYDLRKEVKRFVNSTEPVNCLNDVLDLLSMEKEEEGDYGVRQCNTMCVALAKIMDSGHILREPEIIKEKLEPGVCNKDERVDEDTVVRARGLPWQSSDQDIARFFKGLNVERGGVALCLSSQGRRNGEALIRFEGKEHRDLALRKHKHHIGQRYIEVYKATGDDFIAVAGGSSTEAHEFLSRHSDGGCQIIIRMRGLPYVCNAQQVLDFFEQEPGAVGVLDGEEGVLFVHQADGRATGDAFVLFASEEQATSALAKHRQCIGSRYIELFKSTTAEVQQVLNRSLDPRANITSGTGEFTDVSMLPSIITFPLLQTSSPPSGHLILPARQQQLIASGAKKDCIRIRNLPLETQVAEILNFLGDHGKHIVYKGVHLVFNSRGVPSGEAFIQMDTEFSAQVTAGARNSKVMYTGGNKKHYIEVIQVSGDEMNMLLSNGLHQLRFPGNQLSTFTVCSFPGATSPQNMPLFIPTHLNPPPLLPTPIHTTPFPRQMITGVPASTDNQGAELSVVYNTTATPFYHPFPDPHHHSVPLAPPPTHFLHPTPLETTIQATPASNPPHLIIPQHHAPPSLQPIVYWYPSQSIPAQETIYMPVYPTTVLIKGLPPSIHPNDILSFLEGQYEMAPEVQMGTGADGRLTGEAYVTFASKNDAERVINQHAGKSVGGKKVEMFVV